MSALDALTDPYWCLNCGDTDAQTCPRCGKRTMAQRRLPMTDHALDPAEAPTSQGRHQGPMVPFDPIRPFKGRDRSYQEAWE